MADPLISLTQMRAASGEVDPSAATSNDARYTLAINTSSDLIRDFTGLKFEISSGIADTRIFEYDGCGYLDIDEAQNITVVSSQAGYSGALLTPFSIDDYSSYPLNLPVKLWLRLPGVYYGGISPEMGFTYNLDTLYYKYPIKPNIIRVTATWGWDEIPWAVQQAAIWTAINIADSPKPFQQESIENYSRTRGSENVGEAIPDRAQVALLPYVIPRV